MADDQQQINLPSLAVILVLSGLIIRYLFFSPPAGSSSSSSSSRSERAAGDPAALVRQREAAVERIRQMFPQVDRRTALWDLQRTGGNVAATAERILAGRLETPPPPPAGSTSENSAATPQSKPAAGPAHPDLITRYRLQEKLRTPENDEEGSGGGSEGVGKGAGKAWSSSREERESLLQKRRDQMILEARKKMEAKLAAEKGAGNS
ncbi:hypothetical protein N658DRAFT_514461 [Parathielavia hyrcaniae]|uniref:Coupling of ubiquitin conjugation to ER degradation protein 1 n=1 Tax=Parathielavia hyrcaniae TaxID=113614 RepID=A0AAN6Q4X3_9PEZI|nr:hypothetical protein N658DRAFT_514461 [Parathielavia hyrcaniae]